MKRINQILALLIIGAMTLMLSCSKEESKTKPVGAENLSPYDQQVNKTIKQFRQTIAFYHENPNFKSGETVSADSALWLLEATINYSHAFPNEYYDQFKVDSAYITVPKNLGGTISVDALVQKYDELKAEVTTLYYSSGFENKGLVVVDLKESSQNATEITILAETITGDKGNEPPPVPPVLGGPFEAGDNWWFGDEGGLCIENEGEGSDAATELFNEIVNEIPDPAGNYYFINHADYDIEGGNSSIRRDGWNDPEDNHVDYLLFYASTSVGTCGSDTLCVEWTEMNTYYSYLKLLIFSYLPEHEPLLYGKSIEEVFDVDGYSEYDALNDVFKYKHLLKTKFGEQVGYSEGESPEDL